MDVGLYVNMIFLKTAIHNIWYEYVIILLQKGLNISNENIQKKNWKYSIQDLLFYILQIVWLHKAYCFIAKVTQASNVAHWPFVLFIFSKAFVGILKTGKLPSAQTALQVCKLLKKKQLKKPIFFILVDS